MIPSGLSSPTVFCAKMKLAPPSTVGCSAELIDRMSFAPGLLLLVFQMGNLLVEPVMLMT
jgi:hypothetical protein